MTYNQLPQPQGLYRPEFEHDACGIGLYAHLKGEATHSIVKKGLQMLCQLDHRGGQGSDPYTGDGAGLMVQLPDAFFRKNCQDLALPEKGRYGVGMVFFSKDDDAKTRQAIEQKINGFIKQEGQTLIGWRTVPVDAGKIGTVAAKSCPVVRQVFIGANDNITDRLSFERKLYVIRKQAENWGTAEEKQFYFVSLSSQTIVYKGLLTSDQVDAFYLDLQDETFVSAFSLVHSRFSTNTFPTWERAHPNRYLIHNGEINTLRGNINWMRAREQQFVSEAFGEDLDKILPVLNADGSDSSILDNAFEFFVLAGRTPAHTAMMLIPEPWTENTHMSKEKRAFYEYHSSLMEPWDGPTAISFTDGKQIGAILDRNGLRPARYYVTNDDHIIFSSEVGVIDTNEEDVKYKDRLEPGKMLLIDLEEGRIISDEEVKSSIANELPYQKWLDEEMVHVNRSEENSENSSIMSDLLTRQRAFHYTYEDIQKYLIPLLEEGKDPIGSMGSDTPLAVLSDRAQSLFSYFKQLFAQVTNPPIDAIREQLVTSTMTWLGAEGDILHPNEYSCRRIKLYTPVLTSGQFNGLKTIVHNAFKSKTIHTLFTDDLKRGLDAMFEEAEKAIREGVSLLILSDRDMTEEKVPIPPLLALSALHQHLVRQGLRTKVSLIVESGEVREVHHFAALIGYGADAIHPYLVYETYKQLIAEEAIAISFDEAVTKFGKSVTEGVVKVMSKVGISTVQSYRGAQIFEAVGISEDVIQAYFTGTASQLGGIDLDTIASEAKLRHEAGYQASTDQTLESGSEFQWRKNGEHHAFNPKTIHTLQWACRNEDYDLFKQYTKAADEERIGFLRNLFAFRSKQKPVRLEEVESAESIVRRFKTGAMSFGSLSKEAHEALAIAMNRIGGKSNSGEGGEDPARFTVDEHGDDRRSAIKQIASGRFGVKSHYLVNADELQIKMAQGAKPGEGGQLPGNKVYPWVADVRGSTPGVGLISPPPHHDIYSIEDLAQLIHDLKNANRDARISVKLVSKAGVGTIAAGVAKGTADVIVISGYDGGTGASPKTSIKHTGLPWELGLAEAHQTLVLNGLRERVVLETDGKLMTGRDVVMAAILGAEEYGFATAPLVVLGCVMMRACHLDTCPVGVATQNPELRKKFMGDPDHIVNFMMFIAEEVREILAELGFTSMDELIGRTDVLSVSERAKSHWKAGQLNLETLLYQPEGPRTFRTPQNHKIDESLDMNEILPYVQEALDHQTPVDLSLNIRNIHRVAGTITGSEVSKRYGEEGLPEDTITLRFTGSAGQSFGAFVPKGMSLYLTGDSNDYIGKGLSGGKIAVKTSDHFVQNGHENVIVGNVAFYGATSGKAFINGRAGERFAVRNSGVNVVVEGIGDHGCEYMTGGRVVILGDVGKNFGAGMSGGIAYVHTSDAKQFKRMCNMEMIMFEKLTDHEEEQEVKQMIQEHLDYTNSSKAAALLENWAQEKNHFIKIIPRNYKMMLQSIEEQKQAGLSHEEAVMFAFEANTKPKNKETANGQKAALAH
ncbi:glutamate synthase large subunit [Bacillus altitudinis MN12]|uniref:glutamate synthase large subunit n=1 Tax=Bacillus TaxID=1386 RepID=UPI001B82CE99|nr:glutamate synthase large subunit [Bacillus altitudinis]MBR0583275.1 glutamate synthase large subunit [Bacillus altitudinis MN12]MBR0592549.1 glutamate synthase large subunit [Bacillus altitudinis C16B11]MBR0609287.1 glutamate synthase large subunit [Bacillus altitudinis]